MLTVQDTVADEMLSPGLQALLLTQVDAVARVSPPRRYMTPMGSMMRVLVTNAGSLGWGTRTKDRVTQYCYSEHDPDGLPWAPMPQLWTELATKYAGTMACPACGGSGIVEGAPTVAVHRTIRGQTLAEGTPYDCAPCAASGQCPYPWDAAVVNWYPWDPGGKPGALGQHVDRTEANKSLPVVTIPLGLPAVWAVWSASGIASRMILRTGQVTVLREENGSRGAQHAIERIVQEPEPLFHHPLLDAKGKPIHGRWSISVRCAA